MELLIYGYVHVHVFILDVCVYSLLYGQMRYGGNKGLSRKGPILRFIAACGEREIDELVSIITEPYSTCTSKNTTCI